MRIFVDLVIINNSQNRIMDEIVKELHTLKLSGMARLWASLGETKRLDKLTLVDGLMLLLQAERDTRTTNRNTRLVKEADFRYSSTLEQLQASSHRGIVSIRPSTSCLSIKFEKSLGSFQFISDLY